MTNVQGAGFLSNQEDPGWGCPPACLPGETLLCVWLPWLSSVCFLSPPPFSFPALLRSCRLLWMWWWICSSTMWRISGRTFGMQQRHLVTAAQLSPAGRIRWKRLSVGFKPPEFRAAAFTLLLFLYVLCSDDELERVIPREKLVSLCKYEPVRLWMRSCDHILYQALVEILIPDVLRPVPSQCPSSHSREGLINLWPAFMMLHIVKIQNRRTRSTIGTLHFVKCHHIVDKFFIVYVSIANCYFV